MFLGIMTTGTVAAAVRWCWVFPIGANAAAKPAAVEMKKVEKSFMTMLTQPVGVNYMIPLNISLCSTSISDVNSSHLSLGMYDAVPIIMIISTHLLMFDTSTTEPRRL